eukprot:2067362-Ditylum_brightwellii.AAC.1
MDEKSCLDLLAVLTVSSQQWENICPQHPGTVTTKWMSLGPVKEIKTVLQRNWFWVRVLWHQTRMLWCACPVYVYACSFNVEIEFCHKKTLTKFRVGIFAVH